jgi:hypothetical protein
MVKNIAVICGTIMMIAAVTLLCIFHSMLFPCVVLFIIGLAAMGDGMEEDKKKDR